MIRGKDIAALVGVSRPAVTAVLNGSRPHCVSKEKREAILKIASEYQYRPNQAAVALKTGRSRLIGVVMPPWDNPYIAGLCMGLQRCLAAKNYTCVFAIDNNYNPVPGNLKELLSLNIAGLITVAASLLPDSIGVPVVSYYHNDPRFDCVCPDLARDARLIVGHLKECGHKNFGYLGLNNDKRIKYLAEEAARCGLDFPKRWQSWSSNDKEEGKDPFSLLLKKNKGRDLPGALVVLSDNVAIYAYQSIRRHKFRIPEDFSIVSHDNIAYSGTLSPALTSLSFGSPDEIAGEMVRLLMERIREPGKPREVTRLQSVLIERESVSNKV